MGGAHRCASLVVSPLARGMLTGVGGGGPRGAAAAFAAGPASSNEGGLGGLGGLLEVSGEAGALALAFAPSLLLDLAVPAARRLSLGAML